MIETTNYANTEDPWSIGLQNAGTKNVWMTCVVSDLYHERLNKEYHNSTINSKEATEWLP